MPNLRNGHVALSVLGVKGHHIVSMDLKAYGRCGDSNLVHQEMLNAPIVPINQEIRNINGKDNVPTPWITSRNHRYRSGE